MLKMTIARIAVLLVAAFVFDVSAAADLKIGVVKAAKVLSDAPQAKAASDRIESEFSPRKDEIVAMQKDIRDLEERLQRDSAVMKEAERNRLERDILDRKRDARRAQDEFREDLNIRRNEELGKLQRLVDEQIKQLAKEQGFDLVLSDAGTVYVSDKADITQLVIDRLTREFRGGR